MSYYIEISKEEVFDFIDFMFEEDNYSQFELRITLDDMKKVCYTYTSSSSQELKFTRYQNVVSHQGFLHTKVVNGKDLKERIKNDFESPYKKIVSIGIIPSSMYEQWSMRFNIKPARG